MPAFKDAGIVFLGLVLFLSETVSAIALGALNVLIRSDRNVDGTYPEAPIISCKHSQLIKTVSCNSEKRHYIDDSACLTTLSEAFRDILLAGKFRNGCPYQGCAYDRLSVPVSSGMTGSDIPMTLKVVVRI